MKNKCAERAKKKRRAEKRAEYQQERKRILSQFEVVARKNGIENYNKQSVWQTFRQIDRELTEKSIVYSVVVVAYSLHKNYGWGQVKLSRYTQMAHKYLKTVGNNIRSISEMKEELKLDAGFDWDMLIGDYKPYKGKSEDPKQDEGQVLAQKMAYVLPMALYTLYYDEGWKSKRMNRIGQDVKQILVEVIENNGIWKLKETLKSECKMRFCDDGTVYINE